MLEPEQVDGEIVSEKWVETECRGGFVDIGHARIFGSHWYGASANWAILELTRTVKLNRREDGFHIVMLHTDVEGHETHPDPRPIDELAQRASRSC